MMEVDGCFVIEDRYDQRIFSDWKKSSLSLTKLEAVTTVYEVTDFLRKIQKSMKITLR